MGTDLLQVDGRADVAVRHEIVGLLPDGLLDVRRVAEEREVEVGGVEGGRAVGAAGRHLGQPEAVLARPAHIL